MQTNVLAKLNEHKNTYGRYFARDDHIFHTNNIEGFWAIMKRSIYGVYHSVSQKRLHRYCNEFSYRYNVRGETGTYRFEGAIQKADSARITYKQLIGKAKSFLGFSFLFVSFNDLSTKSLNEPLKL